MEKVCPCCNKPVQPYHQFCPWCEADFFEVGTKTEPMPSAESDSKEKIPETDFTGQNSDSDVKPTSDPEGTGDCHSSEHQEVVCPSCNALLTDNLNFCSACGQKISSSSQPADIQTSPPDSLNNSQSDNKETLPSSDSSAVAVRCIYCPTCGNALPIDYHVCNTCGSPIYQETQPAAPQIYSEIAQSQISYPFINISEKIHSGSPVPITIHFNFGKTYQKGSLDILEFRIINAMGVPITNLDIVVRGNCIKTNLRERLSSVIPNTAPIPLYIGNFLPCHSGRDALKILITGTVHLKGDFHLTGTLPVVIEDTVSTPQHVNISINAGDIVGDTTIPIPSMERGRSAISGNDIPRWENVPLFWDIEKMERVSRCFPPACVSPNICSLGKECVNSLRSISPESAPKAAISCGNGDVYYLIAGNTLSVGRVAELNHFQAILFPIETFPTENKQVSKQHCQIMVRNERVYLRDTSVNGCFINNQIQPKNKDILLSHDDIVSIANILEIRIKVFTDGCRILCVRIDRIRNKTQEHHLLIPLYVPIGSAHSLPVVLAGIPELCGLICYQPQVKTWQITAADASLFSSQEIPLGVSKEIRFGNSSYWFSSL